MKTIVCDTRQKLKHHEVKEQYFVDHGYNILRSKLPVGDYSRIDKMVVCVDTKQDLQEVVGNICGKEHDRFKRECILAQSNGIKLIVLVEEDNIKNLDDVSAWHNPRLDIYTSQYIQGQRKRVQKYPKATKGETLAKAMRTMQLKYGVEFMFCPKDQAGKRVVELLFGEEK